ncbi:3897_t:CDS:2 [Funneliformis mosseae]|uniref:Protein transport protein SFT2 n=1 Tax=Funneliformis mosseae TaxID=27381 RepID=A0A9N9AEV0_FUNMO|nr:3897_t:CDS:2 [Funneliformis mosseae]
MKLWDSFEFGDQGTMDETSPFDDCFKLSKKQRLYGFGICFALGFIISILSTLSLLTSNITGFAILYTIGNVISLMSTGFLVGFKKQIKTMFAPVRWFASLIYLGTLVLTLVVAFTVQQSALNAAEKWNSMYYFMLYSMVGIILVLAMLVTYPTEGLSSKNCLEVVLIVWYKVEVFDRLFQSIIFPYFNSRYF